MGKSGGHISTGQSSLVFDPKERLDYVQGFGKRKKERLERSKAKAQEREREIRKLLRKKRKEALEKIRQDHGIKSDADEETNPAGC